MPEELEFKSEELCFGCRANLRFPSSESDRFVTKDDVNNWELFECSRCGIKDIRLPTK